jgi:hypothetical protein
VVFLNTITPGNFGFIQELGVATVLSGAATTQAASGNAIVTSGSTANGTMAASAATYSQYTIGTVIDAITAPLVNTPFKILLTGPAVQD